MQTRRHHLLGLLSAAALFPSALCSYAQDSDTGSQLAYRGFNANISDVGGGPDREVILNSLRHQIDIVADCGAKTEIIDFFRTQTINLRAGFSDSGKFDSNKPGVTINAAIQPPEKPILLHEMLHAYHFRDLPSGFENPDIVHFYESAVAGAFYKAGSYVMKNVQEFFAVTGSLYLWGHVDRPPFTRDALKERQPDYYDWLGQLFGVQK